MTEVRLSSNQRKVVEFEEGPIAVIAGPGSGKTRVLTERIRRLLTKVPGHFRVLALTFTNKAAKEMNDRLADLVEVRKRAFIGTMHSFCLDVLADRGKHVGLAVMPHIFEHYQDRKQILMQAVEQDPELQQELEGLVPKERNARIDSWLKGISTIKAHPDHDGRRERRPHPGARLRGLQRGTASLRSLRLRRSTAVHLPIVQPVSAGRGLLQEGIRLCMRR